jgi:transcriptional regulator with XRE-family HTH domain
MVDRDPTALIAGRLRQERRARQWSLDEFARQAGVSKAMLSKLERGEASPTAVMLGRISGALGLSISNLLADPGQEASRLVRRAQQPVWKDPLTHYVRRQVSPLGDMPVQLVEVALPPRRVVEFPASSYSFIRQLIWVLAGSLEFREGAQTHRLEPGDCLELGPPADCSFRNRGRSTCRYVVVLTRR